MLIWKGKPQGRQKEMGDDIKIDLSETEFEILAGDHAHW
jgi:hypothetical protein